MSKEHRTASAEETEALAARLASELRAGDVVLLAGDLGAGKTTFVRGASRALGYTGPVTSPTFTIGRRYPGRDVQIAHLDLYRLGSLAGEEPGLLDDYVGPGTITFVEWPEVAEGELSASALTVRMSHTGGDGRLIAVE